MPQCIMKQLQLHRYTGCVTQCAPTCHERTEDIGPISTKFVWRESSELHEILSYNKKELENFASIDPKSTNRGLI